MTLSTTHAIYNGYLQEIFSDPNLLLSDRFLKLCQNKGGNKVIFEHFYPLLNVIKTRLFSVNFFNVLH